MDWNCSPPTEEQIKENSTLTFAKVQRVLKEFQESYRNPPPVMPNMGRWSLALLKAGIGHHCYQGQIYLNGHDLERAIDACTKYEMENPSPKVRVILPRQADSAPMSH